jgi:hypothetical protein
LMSYPIPCIVYLKIHPSTFVTHPILNGSTVGASLVPVTDCYAWQGVL